MYQQIKKAESITAFGFIFGAGNEVRTRDLNLGKVALYQLSYSRMLLFLLQNFFITKTLEARTRVELV